MNLQQAKIILEKINRLYQSITLDSKIDIHEQELMLSYIRQFYSSFSGDANDLLDSRTTRTTKIVQQTSVSPPPAPAPTPTPTPKVVKKEVPPPVVKEPVVVEVPKVSSPPPAPKVVVKKEEPVVVSTPAPTPVPTPPKVSPAPVSKTTSKKEEEFDVLFEHKEAKELSDKLADAPIRDLTKAISINEKILAIQELFGKDSEAYTKSISQLNSFRNFDEAKPFLSELAKTYKWTTKSRTKKAKVFIKMIRRRYK